MKSLNRMFIISACIHMVIVGVLLVGIRFAKRHNPSAVHRVRIVEMKKKTASVSRTAEAGQVKVKKPAQEVKVKTESEKEKERSKKLDEFLKKRKRLEQLRKRREEEQKKEHARKQEEAKKLDEWSEELGGRKTLQELTVDSAVVFPAWFIDEIHNRIFSVWDVPPAADESVAKVSFEILRSGDVSGIEVEKTSGSSVFDSSCQEAVRKASPFPQLPALFKGDSVRVHVTFKEE